MAQQWQKRTLAAVAGPVMEAEDTCSWAQPQWQRMLAATTAWLWQQKTPADMLGPGTAEKDAGRCSRPRHGSTGCQAEA